MNTELTECPAELAPAMQASDPEPGPSVPDPQAEPQAAGAAEPARPGPGPGLRFVRFVTWSVLHVVLPVAVLGGAALYAEHLLSSGPEARKRTRTATARVVETIVVRNETVRSTVDAMGNVVAAREIDLRPRVTGAIEWVSADLSPGMVVRAGSEVARFDPADFQIQVRLREASLAEAEADLQLEKGRQALALREYELLGTELADEDRDRVLRAPQWAQAQAVLDARRTELERARLDLERATVRAPFDALVRTRDIEPGAQVSTASRLTHLVGVSEFWVEVVLPLDRVRFLRFPGDRDSSGEVAAEGSRVTIEDASSWGPGAQRTGRVLRLLSDLETGGRMARLLVAVDDPLSLDRHRGEPRLLLGAYVRVRIEGEELADVVAVDAAFVREGDKAWVLGAEGGLEIRQLEIALRDRERVYVTSGLGDGDQVITTALSTPVAGMPLSVKAESPADGGTEPEPEPEPEQEQEASQGAASRADAPQGEASTR